MQNHFFLTNSFKKDQMATLVRLEGEGAHADVGDCLIRRRLLLQLLLHVVPLKMGFLTYL